MILDFLKYKELHKHEPHFKSEKAKMMKQEDYEEKGSFIHTHISFQVFPKYEGKGRCSHLCKTTPAKTHSTICLP